MGWMSRQFGRSAAGSRARFRGPGPLAVAVTGLLLLAAGCAGSSNGPGVARAGATPTSSPSSTLPRREAALAFSRCMRAHGIKDFPDPTSGGNIAIQGGPGSDLGPNNLLFQSAQRACQSLMPAPTAADQQQALSQALKFSQCMRAHGIKDFPDPKANNGAIGIQIRGGPGGDLNPNNPLFQSAQKACQHDLPGGGKGFHTSTSGGGR